MQRRVRATAGALEGKHYILGQRTVLGRSGDTDIQILDKGVSRQHACLIEDDNGNILLMDLGSRNGTWVAGERITKRFLEHGDTFQIGESAFVFEEASTHPGIDPTADDESEFKLLSGPALESTAVARVFDPHGRISSAPRVRMPGEALGCQDPLHVAAQLKGWRHCPACGGLIEPG